MVKCFYVDIEKGLKYNEICLFRALGNGDESGKI